MKISGSFLFLVACLLCISGCTHDLNVENIGSYRSVKFDPLEKPLKLGIVTESTNWEHKQLIANITDMLMEHSVQPVTQQSVVSKMGVDAIAKIDIKSTHDASGTNFWIEWPGFLIFTPSWNGYIYEVNYNFKIQLIHPATQKVIDEFSVPISLDIRHADIGRTWTEISWLEVSLIAFISGFVFTSYDDSVTPLLIQKYGQDVGRYVAKHIINHLKSNGGFANQEKFRDISLAMFANR